MRQGRRGRRAWTDGRRRSDRLCCPITDMGNKMGTMLRDSRTLATQPKAHLLAVLCTTLLYVPAHPTRQHSNNALPFLGRCSLDRGGISRPQPSSHSTLIAKLPLARALRESESEVRVYPISQDKSALFV